MSSRRLKARVMALLAQGGIDHILTELEPLAAQEVVHALFSAICRSQEPLRWHAVQAMGATVARLADLDMEQARIVMRRLLWSLNDESGSIGWGAPEALAEIMSRHSGLAGEYLHMLISYMREDGPEPFQDGNYLEHTVLQQGLMWGIGRLAVDRPELLLERGVAVDLLPYLSSNDHVVRGLAARALGLLGAASAAEAISPLVADSSPVSVYEDGEMRSVSVGELSRKALQMFRVRR